MTEKARTVQRITDRLAEKAKARGADRLTIWEIESPGFCLRVSRTGAKSFAVARRVRGQAAPVRVTLPQANLAAARTEARRLIELMRKGVDPRPMLTAEREAAKAKAAKLAADTFSARWAIYEAKHVVTLKDRTQVEVRRPYRRFFEPKFGNRPLAEITRGELQATLDKIEAPISANRAFAVLRHFLGWCVRRGYLDANPCPMERPNPAGADRTRVLGDEELRDLWTAELAYPAGAFLKLLLLTGQRRGEVAGIRWSEIKGNDWSLPAERTKAGRAHVVPISDAALAVLAACPRFVDCDFVLTLGGKTAIGDFSGIKAKIDTASGVGDWRVHDIRRTVGTGLERLGVDYPTRAAVLNHSKSAVEGVTAIYSRHDYAAEKRRALDLWAKHLEALVTPPASNVISIGKPGAAA